MQRWFIGINWYLPYSFENDHFKSQNSSDKPFKTQCTSGPQQLGPHFVDMIFAKINNAQKLGT